MLAVCFTNLDIHCFRFLPHDYTDGIMQPRIAVSGNNQQLHFYQKSNKFIFHGKIQKMSSLKEFVRIFFLQNYTFSMFCELS